MIMVVLLTCKGPRARAALTTYVVPHCLEPAKEAVLVSVDRKFLDIKQGRCFCVLSRA